MQCQINEFSGFFLLKSDHAGRLANVQWKFVPRPWTSDGDRSVAHSCTCPRNTKRQTAGRSGIADERLGTLSRSLASTAEDDLWINDFVVFGCRLHLVH